MLTFLSTFEACGFTTPERAKLEVISNHFLGIQGAKP
jgi:hypothetical protein